MPILTRAIRAIDKTLIAVAAFALLAMMIHICIDVFSGLVFNAPIAVTSAFVTQYYMIAVAFLPLAAGEYRGAHISIDLFVNRLASGPRRSVHLMMLMIALVFYSILAAQAWQQASMKLASGAFVLEQTSRVTVWPSYFVMPLSFGLIALLIAVKILCTILNRPEPVAPAASEEHPLEGFPSG